MSIGYENTLRKVPKITFLFWVIKLLTTAMGESTSDYSVHFNPYIAVVCGFIAFVIVLIYQLSRKRYIPWVYWLSVLMVAIFGTMAADVTHIVLHVPYAISTAVFAVVLAIVLYAWYKSEGTLSIHSITNSRRELFYWATILSTFALGTAAGDLAAYGLGLGPLSAGIVFCFVFLVPAVGYWLFRFNSIFAFWFAYILTRPIGASFADYMGKPHSVGGLNWGDGPVAGVLSVFIIVLVAYLQLTHKDEELDPRRPRQRRHAI